MMPLISFTHSGFFTMMTLLMPLLENGFAPISNKKSRNSNLGLKFSFKKLSRAKIAHYSTLFICQSKRVGDFHALDFNFSTFLTVMGANPLWLFKSSGL